MSTPEGFTILDVDDDGKGDFVLEEINGKRVYVSLTWLAKRVSVVTGAVVATAAAIWTSL